MYAKLRSTILGDITPNHQHFIRIMSTDNEQIIKRKCLNMYFVHLSLENNHYEVFKNVKCILKIIVYKSVFV